MTPGRLETLQWVGLLAGALVWTAAFLAGIGTTGAGCSVAGTGRGLDGDAWQIALHATALVLVLGAESAAVLVFARTRSVGKDDAPPEGRVHFFAAAALVANTLFLCIIVLSAVGSIAANACRGA